MILPQTNDTRIVRVNTRRMPHYTLTQIASSQYCAHRDSFMAHSTFYGICAGLIGTRESIIKFLVPGLGKHITISILFL